MSFPTVSVEQMREVDRIMVEDLGIELLQMMENAGRALAHRARAMLGGDAVGRRVTVLSGSGGNGGGGMVAARRLALWGAPFGEPRSPSCWASPVSRWPQCPPISCRSWVG